MDLLILLINVAGAVTLLLWAVRMVRTGFERAAAGSFRAAIRRSQTGRVKASAVGAVVALLLQSSTAVAIIAAGFAATGVLDVAVGLAMLLGADLGSALVVQFLSFKIDWLMPLLTLLGGTLFLQGSTVVVRQAGRIILGIGLILLSLTLLADATASLKGSEFLSVVMTYLEADNVTAFILGALITWLLHSSVASILLLATLVSQAVVPFPVALAFILGANLGAGLIAYGLTRGLDPLGRRVPIGNLVFRALGAVVLLLGLRFVQVPIASSPAVAAQWVVYVHLGFNALLLVCCLPLVGLMSTLTRQLLPDPIQQGAQLDPLLSRKSVLDRSVLHIPKLALASATRECLRMSDVVELMLQPVMKFYSKYDASGIAEVRKLELMVNQLHSDIKLYLSDIEVNELSEPDSDRMLQLTNFAINLEAVGDLIAKNLLPQAERKNEDKLTFSSQGWDELKDLHKQVLSNMHLALNTLVSGDLHSARQLIQEKERMGEQERQSSVSHLHRLQEGAPETIETSEIHLETLRALKQINSLFASVAYPILSQSGELLNSRLSRVGDKKS